MSSKNRSRGREGKDDYFFGEGKMQGKIYEAIADLSFLLERGYGESSSCQLVGNRYKLGKRQQQALRGMSASHTAVEKRRSTRVEIKDLNNTKIALDGFNVLILLESVLSEAYIFKGVDGAYRDLSSVHGSYKKVSQTHQAIYKIGAFLEQFELEQVLWVFDKPVSNSGRIKSEILQIAEDKGWDWDVILNYNPDKFLAEGDAIAISSDAWVLDHAAQWFNLMEELIPLDYPYLLSPSIN